VCSPTSDSRNPPIGQDFGCPFRHLKQHCMCPSSTAPKAHAHRSRFTSIGSKHPSLAQFTGTARYYRISCWHLLTDGTKYLAEKAGCFWMMDAIASHLGEIGAADWFVHVRMTVNGSRATMIYEDGCGNEHARQEITCTDFPMRAISLYACWDGGHWVIMLPSEY